MAQIIKRHKIDSSRITKNTIFLYIRMLLIMGVTLYTSRVILDKLGAIDFGIYGAVGGVVAMLGFLNGTLSTGTSRFLMFELSRDNFDKLKATFSTATFAHLLLGILVVLVLELFGVWFINNKLVIPQERIAAAVWVFHISVFTSFISIIQVPYTSAIIAHENMSVYAYVGIFEALAKLIIVYILMLCSWDRLIFYAILVAIVQLIVASIYMIYCMGNYQETNGKPGLDIPIFKQIISFSGWSLLANVSQILSTQGMVVLMNMFFSPIIVAAQTIGTQLSSAVMTFVNNFRTAVNPQIIKLYAAGAYSESRKLTLDSSVYVLELVLLFALPGIVLMERLLDLWLIDVPPYAVIFSQYAVVSQMFNVYNNSFYVPMTASGKLKENSYISLIITFLGFVVLFVCLNAGFDVMWVQYISIIQLFISSFIIKPAILCKYIPDYTWRMIFDNEWLCIKVSLLPIIVTIIVNSCVNVTSFVDMIFVTLVIWISVCTSAIYFMDAIVRKNIMNALKAKLIMFK